MEKDTLSEIPIDELIYFSQQFANMFGFPVRLYKNNEKIFFYSTANLVVDPVELCLNEIIKNTSEIGYYVYNELLYFGIVNYRQYKFIVGPVSELKISDNDLKKIGFLHDIKSEEADLFVSEMKTLSGFHLDTMLQAMVIYNFTVNKTMYDISDIRIKNSEQNNISSNIKENEVSSNISTDFYKNYERSFLIENDITKKVMNGDVQGLIDGATKIPSVSSGNLAPHLLRHQKNFFIRLETIVARAALKAGLDVDEVFCIEEMYIRKCESLNHVDRIKNLQYHMIVDYADRVNKHNQYNKNNSKFVNKIIKYIRNHISESVKTSDIAEYLGKSRGGLTTEFKKQTGMNLSDFIMLKKIQEAEELLYSTDKSIVSISSYLGFSSQSHFCNAFKKIKDITPTEYRNKR